MKRCSGIGERVERGVHPDQREFPLDDGEIGTPDVADDAPEVAGRVIPALPRRAGPVGAAPHGAQHHLLARQQRCTPRGRTRIGDDQVDPGLEVLRDAEVVERHGQQDRVRGEQLVDQHCRQRNGRLLFGRAIGLREVRGADRTGPGVGGQDVNADVPTFHGVAGMGGKPLGLRRCRRSRDWPSPPRGCWRPNGTVSCRLPHSLPGCPSHFKAEVSLPYFRLEVKLVLRVDGGLRLRG